LTLNVVLITDIVFTEENMYLTDMVVGGEAAGFISLELKVSFPCIETLDFGQVHMLCPLALRLTLLSDMPVLCLVL
jgi:hypothetical protein